MNLYTVLAAAVMLSNSALANIVYDNGGYSSSANSFDVQMVADDFKLSTDTLLTGASIFAYSSSGNPELGSIDYSIFAGGGNQPGVLLTSGKQVLTKSTIVANIGSGYRYQYRIDFSFNTPLTVKANTVYWFGAHIGNGYDGPYDRYWNFTDSHSGRDSLGSRFGTADNWANYFGQDRAFYLTGTSIPATPEPSPLAFAIGGASILAIFKVRGRIVCR